MAEAGYLLRFSDDELRRYLGMAQVAVAQEGAAWQRCGVVPGARVADLGCGPGAVLVEIARRVGPSGRVTGVDQDEDAVAAAGRLIRQAGLDNAEVTRGDVTGTGLDADAYDVVMIRHVLAHNGPRAVDIVRHAAGLLRPGGHLWLADVAADASFVDPADEAVEEAMRRYRQLHASGGNDLNLGPRLGSLMASVGLEVVHRQAYVSVRSPFPADGGPIWAAREALVSGGLATPDDLDRWRAAAARLATLPYSAMFVSTFTAAGRRPVATAG